jgi:hypothetical protein
MVQTLVSGSLPLASGGDEFLEAGHLVADLGRVLEVEGTGGLIFNLKVCSQIGCGLVK